MKKVLFLLTSVSEHVDDRDFDRGRDFDRDHGFDLDLGRERGLLLALSIGLTSEQQRRRVCIP